MSSKQDKSTNTTDESTGRLKDSAADQARAPTADRTAEQAGGPIGSIPRSLVIPATVILERRMISRSFWSLPSWYLHTVATGSQLIAANEFDKAKATAVGVSDKGDLFAWSGLDVTLYKDACERYWHALIGDKPLVYVICRDDTDETDGASSDALTMQPISVTVDYDEASAAAETDIPVLSKPITGELYRYMEQFVLAHYKPQEFKKRKRKNWSDGDVSRSSGAPQQPHKQHKGGTFGE